MVRSDCPSVYGWNAVDMFKLVLYFFQSVCHKLLVKRASLSLTILFGMPCFATTSLKIRSAMFAAVAGSLVGKNLAILLNLSTTTSTPVWPSVVAGKSVRKSMEMSCQGPAGVGNGWSNPAGFLEDSLLLWQISQAAMCLVTACCNLGDQNCFLILARVLWTPMWPNLS